MAEGEKTKYIFAWTDPEVRIGLSLLFELLDEKGKHKEMT